VITHAIDAMVSKVVERHGRIDILVNNAGGTVPAPHAEDIRLLVSRIQGAPRSDDDFERTALFHAFAIQMNLIQPAVVRRPCLPPNCEPDGTGCIINVSSGAGHPAGSPTLCLRLRRSLDSSPDPIARRGVGPPCAGQCVALGPTITENFRAFVLPKDDPTGSTYFDALPSSVAANRAEVGRTCVFLASAQPTSSTAPPSRSTAAMLPGVLYEAGLKTITDLL